MELEGHAQMQEGETISTRTICEQEVHYRFVSTEKIQEQWKIDSEQSKKKQHELNSEPATGK